MLVLKVTDELNQLVNGLKGFTGQELNRIVLRTINAAAYDAEYGLIKEMKNVFSNPTRYTLKSLFVKKATSSRLIANVGFKEFAGKGTSAGEYLKPQIFGGPRPRKRSEKALVSLQINGRNLYLTPGPSARLNRYGNIPASKYVEVLSYFKAFNQTGYAMNRSKESTKKRNIAGKFFMAFADDPRTAHLSPGIYERRRGAGFIKIFNFTKEPKYRARFDFYRVGFEYAAAKFRANFNYQVERTFQEILRRAA